MKLICACCGGEALGKKQWHNQDTGYGVCPRCFALVVEREGREQAINHYGRPGVHHSLDETPTLFDLVLSTHTPFHSHASDLYIPATNQTRAMLKEFPQCDANKITFTNQVEGGLWFDIPFAFVPWWDALLEKGKA